MAEVRLVQRTGVASLLPTTERTRYNWFAQQPTLLTDRISPAPVAVRFAHPAENVVASMFTAHGVPWEYEPTTFPLVTGLDGKSIQSFTPDFYLPEDHVYIEMTTMRQSLVTRKNRKFRLMRELYPDVNVKLLYRKDVELIVHQFRNQQTAWTLDLDQPAIRTELILRRAADCARQLAGSDRSQLTLLAVDPGARHFRDLIAAELTALGRNTTTGDVPGRVSDEAEIGITDVNLPISPDSALVLVADVVSTGVRLRQVRAGLRSFGCAEYEVVTLLSRPSARLFDAPIAFAGFTVPSEWFVGGGLGATSEHRDLPDLYRWSRPASS